MIINKFIEKLDEIYEFGFRALGEKSKELEFDDRARAILRLFDIILHENPTTSEIEIINAMFCVLSEIRKEGEQNEQT